VPQYYDLGAATSPTTIALFVGAMSFAFPLTLSLAWLVERLGDTPGWLRSLPRRWADRPFVILLALFWVIAVVGGIMLVEPGEAMRNGNDTWGTASAYLSLLPWGMTTAGRLRSRPARYLVWGVFALHMASGAHYLYQFVVRGVF
jgi:hypothetical protein